MSDVSAILQQMAENAGRAQLARGNTYASLVQGIANVPGQILEDRERQATIDLQRAQALATMRYAQNRDARETADQAYQDQTRAQELAKQVKVRAIIQAYTDGTPNDPSTNNLAAGVAKAKEVGLPEYIPNLWELHQKEQQLANPRPYETDPTKDLRDPQTNAILTPGQPKMPEIGTDAYERAVAIKALTNPPALPASSGAPPAPPPGPASSYAGRVDLLQNGPPPSTMPLGGPGAPATTAPPPAADVPAFDAGGTFTGPTTYGPAPAAIAPPMLTPPAAAAPASAGATWGTRADGTPKGAGFLGPLRRPDGTISTEITIGVPINGQETEIPTLVPTLTPVEKNWLLTHDISNPAAIPAPIKQKAIAFAQGRIAAGLSPFAGPGESPPPTGAGTPAILTPPTAAAARPLTMAEATAKVYADQRAAVEAAKDPHSAIYKEWQDYTKQGGTLGFDAYMTMDANRKKPTVSLSGLNTLYTETDPKAIAAAIMRGEREPDTSGLGRPIGAAVDSELAKAGYNKAAAITDWRATQKHIASMNSNQQLKLNQSINALPDLFDSVDALASQWKGGRFPILNKANLALAKQGAYGSDVASVARQLETQIADTTADLGVVYMGGNSPTDHGLQLAATALAGDWDEKVLHDMVKLGKSNALIRRNSINNTGVAGASATNPYAVTPPPPGTPPPAIGAPKEGDTQAIPGYPGTEQTYRGGKWIRTK